MIPEKESADPITRDMIPEKESGMIPDPVTGVVPTRSLAT